MDRESVDRLRFDRRLERRRDWVEDGDRDAHLEALPDVSGKMIRGFDDPDEAVKPEPALGVFPARESIAVSGSYGPGASEPSRAPLGGTPFGGGAGDGSEPS